LDHLKVSTVCSESLEEAIPGIDAKNHLSVIFIKWCKIVTVLKRRS
jgi:hypothetical protein